MSQTGLIILSFTILILLITYKIKPLILKMVIQFGVLALILGLTLFFYFQSLK